LCPSSKGQPRIGASHLDGVQFEGSWPDILRAVLNIASEGILVVDSASRIVVFNPGAEAIFGYKAREILGKPLERLIPEPYREAHGGHLAQFAAGTTQSRRMSNRREIVGLRKNGETFPVEVGLSKLETAAGQIFTAIVRDVSERRETERLLALSAAEARAADQAKSTFLATMSHEIRTPLNGVIGMAQVMARDELPAAQRDRLDVIRQSGESLLVLLNDLLDLSKIESGNLQLEEADFDIEDLMRDVRGTFQAVAANKALEFHVDVAQTAAGRYLGDPLRLRQILNNLVSNALKFTAKGSVQVAVRRRDGVLRFSVRDSGIGIAADRVASIFDRFQQADLTISRRFGGSGLGLAICRELAEMMGGSIEVASAAGEGTEFTVVLPLRRISAGSAPATARRPRQEDAVCADGSADLRILIAEDNPTNQMVLRAVLGQLEITPEIVGDGQLAIEAWEREPWDVILMDIQMPRLDGISATGIIRSREAAERLPRTPIIALTANVMEHQKLEYLTAGVDRVLGKPIEIADLLEALQLVG
jgi:PAS domain S-box-containing protein